MKDECQAYPARCGGEVGNLCHFVKLSEMQSSRTSAKEESDSEKYLIRTVMTLNSQDWELSPSSQEWFPKQRKRSCGSLEKL